MKFSLNGVIDYYSILKFLFYKIFFMIRTNCRLRSRFVNLNFCLRLFFFLAHLPQISIVLDIGKVDLVI